MRKQHYSMERLSRCPKCGQHCDGERRVLHDAPQTQTDGDAEVATSLTFYCPCGHHWEIRGRCVDAWE